jgi:hypothetical protein
MLSRQVEFPSHPIISARVEVFILSAQKKPGGENKFSSRVEVIG